MKEFEIAGKRIGGDAPCFIIAEAGSNHDRNFDQALKLIDVAVSAGADAVKFQVFSADEIAARTTDTIVSLAGDQFGAYGKDLHELYKKVELPIEWLSDLKKYADEKGILFTATPFHEGAVDLLEKINVPFYKIASFELVHLPLIRYAAKTGKPIILSTGMATMEEIDEAVAVLKEVGNEKYAFLHCGIGYPPSMEDINLAAMDTMRDHLGCPIGYSDHTLGITIPIAAVARGAKVYEKHYTIDKGLSGPDHQFALSPDELKNMIQAIWDVEKAIGGAEKKFAPGEEIYRTRGRHDIMKDDIFTEESFVVLRPGIGIQPKFFGFLIGRRAVKNITKDQPITWDVIEQT